jgi:hypothetical protein
LVFHNVALTEVSVVSILASINRAAQTKALAV